MRRLCLGFILGIVLFSSTAHAEDAGQKKYGVVQNIAEDRAVERVGGIYEPEGIDKYMKRRFDMLADQMNKMDSRLTHVEDQVAEVLARLEEMKEAGKEKKDALPAVNSLEEKKSARISGTGILVGSSVKEEAGER